MAEILARARLANEGDVFAYCVKLIAIFGRVASGKERPNDVDIACQTGASLDDDEELQMAHEDLRRASKRGRFTNTLEWAYWPQNGGSEVSDESFQESVDPSWQSVRRPHTATLSATRPVSSERYR